MTNFTIKNNVKAENAKLVDATAYQDENGTWYIELLYDADESDKNALRRSSEYWKAKCKLLELERRKNG